MEIDLRSVHADIGEDAAGATIFSHSSNVAGMPTASIAGDRNMSIATRLVDTVTIPMLFKTVSSHKIDPIS